MWSESVKDRTALISPKFEVNATSCITFQYYTKFQDSNTSSLSVYASPVETDGGLNRSRLWSINRDSVGWKLGLLELTGNALRVHLNIVNVLGQVGLDKFNIASGKCPELCKFRPMKKRYEQV